MIKNSKIAAKPKIFVLDTNVLLHDPSCLRSFQENDIVIPITVLEEIDKFKKGNEQINYNARVITRLLDNFSSNRFFKEGIPLGKNLGNLYIVFEGGAYQEFSKTFFEDKPDHRILYVGIEKQKENPDRQVILVSKDANLRLKSNAMGLLAQDYLNDKVKQPMDERKHIHLIKTTDALISKMFENKNSLPAKTLKIKSTINEYFVLQGQNSRIPVRYDRQYDCVDYIPKFAVSGIEARNEEQLFALDALMRKDIQLVALTGIAGTGKTLLALAAAIEQARSFKQILLSRPVIPLKNQEMGFLPGDVQEKLAPYMLPLHDNLSVIKNNPKLSPREYTLIEELSKSGTLQITPLAYIRGRSLSDTFFIIDEAQNLTPHEIKTIITRAGEGTKLVFTGDIYQIDSPYLDQRSNGLSYLCEKMEGQSIFTHIKLVKGERSHLAELAGKLL